MNINLYKWKILNFFFMIQNNFWTCRDEKNIKLNNLIRAYRRWKKIEKQFKMSLRWWCETRQFLLIELMSSISLDMESKLSFEAIKWEFYPVVRRRRRVSQTYTRFTYFLIRDFYNLLYIRLSLIMTTRCDMNMCLRFRERNIAFHSILIMTLKDVT